MNLRDVRRSKGLTQEQLAEAAGVDQTTVSDLETGRKRNPSWETVARISKVLGVTPDAIFPISDDDVAATQNANA